MIYLDSSVVLARILVEDRRPHPSLWQELLFASRLLEYEVWVRLNARELHRSHGNVATALINRITLIELKPEVLERALEPFLCLCARSMHCIWLRSSSCAAASKAWSWQATTAGSPPLRGLSAFRLWRCERGTLSFPRRRESSNNWRREQIEVGRYWVARSSRAMTN